MAALNSGISDPEGSRYSSARSRRGNLPPTILPFRKDSGLLAVHYEHRGVTIWDLAAKGILRLSPILRMPLCMTWHSLATIGLISLMAEYTSRNQKANQWDYSAVRWEISTEKKLQTHVFDPFLRFKALSRDGRYAVMQKFMVGQTVFDLVTGKGIFTVVGSGEFVFSDDVSTLVSYDGDGTGYGTSRPESS